MDSKFTKTTPKFCWALKEFVSGVATVVTDSDEAQKVLEQYSLKYDFYLEEGESDEGVIYRLTQAPD